MTRVALRSTSMVVIAILLIAGGTMLLLRDHVSPKPVNDESASLSATATAKTVSDEEVEFDPAVVAKTAAITADIPGDAVTYNGHSYYIFDYKCETWSEGERYCETLGGYLAVINDADENEFLYDYMTSIGYDEVFFGYTDQEKEGTWEWVSERQSDYTDWGINEEGSVEPNSSNENEDYAHMNSSMHDGHWNDKKFGQKTVSIFCEWDLIDYRDKKSTAVVTSETEMRTDVSADADILTTVKNGEVVTVLYLLAPDDADRWYYVQHESGVPGYVEAESLRLQ